MRFRLRWTWLTVLVVIAGCSGVSEKRGAVEGVSSKSLAAGICSYKQGNGADTLLIGQIVLDKKRREHLGLVISGGVIAEIGDPNTLKAGHSDASIIECDQAFISPGFINAHEHTSYSFQFPAAGMQPNYVHRDEWREGLNGKPQLVYGKPTNEASIMAWVELRHLLHGVTTIAGSGGVAGIVKNASSPKTDTYVYVDDMQTFPYGTDVDKNFGSAPCDTDASKLGSPKFAAGVPQSVPYVPHIGEGTNCAAKLELDNYLAYVSKTPGRKFSLIHGVALTQTHLQTLRDNNVSVIWSPRSNLALYGKTVDPSWLIDAGVSVAMGTDWSISGSYNILEEMACGKNVSQAKNSRAITGPELWQMVTTEAAKALGIDKITGSITVGNTADLVIISDPDGSGISRMGSLDQSDIIAVFIDGALLAGDARRLVSPPKQMCPNSIDGKFVCIDFSKYTFTFDQMKSANANNVGLLDTSKEAACKF